MKYAVDVWEYDIQQAGKRFLESKGYSLSSDKNKYVIEVGLIFKEHPELRNEFINALEVYLLKHIGDRKLIRFYVDEIVVNKRIDHWEPHPYFKVREKHLKLIILENNDYVKVYDDDIKISKGFKIQAPDLWMDVANVLNDKIKYKFKHQKLALIGHKYCSFKYPSYNYFIRLKRGGYGIVYTSMVIKHDTIIKTIKIDKAQLSKETYFNLIHKYLILFF